MDNPVIARTYSLMQDAQYDAGRLAEARIECSIQDETVANMSPAIRDTLGYIKVLVDRADLPRALEVLGEQDEANEDESTPDQGDRTERCPNCTAVYYAHKESILKGLGYFLGALGVFLFQSNTKRCSECGHQW